MDVPGPGLCRGPGGAWEGLSQALPLTSPLLPCGSVRHICTGEILTGIFVRTDGAWLRRGEVSAVCWGNAKRLEAWGSPWLRSVQRVQRARASPSAAGWWTCISPRNFPGGLSPAVVELGSLWGSARDWRNLLSQERNSSVALKIHYFLLIKIWKV